MITAANAKALCAKYSKENIQRLFIEGQCQAEAGIRTRAEAGFTNCTLQLACNGWESAHAKEREEASSQLADLLRNSGFIIGNVSVLSHCVDIDVSW